MGARMMQEPVFNPPPLKGREQPSTGDPKSPERRAVVLGEAARGGIPEDQLVPVFATSKETVNPSPDLSPQGRGVLKLALSLFRWKYVVPRVCVVAAIVLAVRFGLDPALHWALVTTGEAAIGAKVEVAELSTSLRDAEIIVTGLSAANPKKPMRNLFEADSVRLALDGNQLLRKRVVVRDGSIDGLAIDSPRTTSGALAPVDKDPSAGPSILDPVVAAAQEQALAWLDDMSARAEQDLMTSLATPQLAQQLEERWPRQYEALKKRADDLRAKAKHIEITFREVKKNPLRNVAKLNELQQQLESTQRELHTVLTEIKGLPKQAKADRAAIDVARKKDEQFLRDTLNVVQLDGAELSRYLLGDAAADCLDQTVYWVSYVRDMIPKSKIERPARLPGTNVLFVDRRLPKFLVQRVGITGAARLDGHALTFAGQITDATSEPKLHPQPMRISLTGSGAVTCQLIVELDRRGDVAHDHLLLDCPRLDLADRTLGNADRLAVLVGPGAAMLKADVRLDGDVLSGVVELRQGAALSVATPMIRDDRLAQVLHESLAGVDRLEAKIELAGTLKRPSYRIESNLGPQLAAGISGAVKRYLVDRKDRLVAKVQGQVDAQMAKLDAARQKAEQELLAKLGEDQQLISQLAPMLGGQPSLEGLAVPQLGKALEKLHR